MSGGQVEQWSRSYPEWVWGTRRGPRFLAVGKEVDQNQIRARSNSDRKRSGKECDAFCNISMLSVQI